MRVILLVIAAAMLTGCPDGLSGLSGVADRGLAQRDFFECGAANTLVICPVGETPDPAVHGDCRSVGAGETTIGDGTCL